MPEISDADYQALIKRSAGYGQLKTQYRQLREQYNELHSSHGTLAGSLEETAGRLAQLEDAAANPPAEGDRVAALTSELRAIKHRAEFDKAASGKVRPEALDDLWQLSGYKPERDEIDAAALASLIDDQVAKRPYLAPAPAATEAPAPPARPGAPTKTAPAGPIPPAEGAARGSSAPVAGDTRTAVDAKYAATGRKADIPGRL